MFNWLCRKQPKCDRWDPETPLLRWNAWDAFTIGDSYEGLFAPGRTGSGKSSTTGKQLALAMLAAGYGGLVMTVKADEAELWNDFCRRTGRLDDLCVVENSCCWRFDFLQALQDSQSANSGLVENIVALLMEVGQVGSRKTGSGGAQGDNVFFQQACRVMLRNGIDLLLMATGKVSVGDLCRLVNSMPCSMEQVRSEEWQRTSYCYGLLKQADAKSSLLRQPRDYAVVLDYVLGEFPMLADRTRSSITATFTAFADLFQRGLLFDLLSNGTTLSPSDIESGKIIVLDLPIKRYGEVGLVAQLVWKLMSQRLLERRAVTPDTRPAFIFCDEAQFFASGVSDALFASTCRSAKIAQVLLTQSISGFHTAYGGGENGRALTDQLLANLSTKVVHATGDTVTSSWAADLCGKSYRMLANFGGSDDGPADWSSMLGLGGGGRSTSGMSESLQYDIEPREFSYLRTGGKANDLLVDAIVLRSGQPFRATGKLWMPTTLSQR